jgi:hypothetical protein
MKQSRGEVDKHIFDWNMKVCNALRYFTQSRLLDTAQTDTYGQVQTGYIGSISRLNLPNP